MQTITINQPKLIPHQSRSDPSRTGRLRKGYTAEVNKRFARVISLVRQSVSRNDALALKKQRIQLFQSTPLGPRQFQFQTPSEKINSFEEWLDDVFEDEILGLATKIESGAALTQEEQSFIREHWPDVFILGAYIIGVKTAFGMAARLGLASTIREEFQSGDLVRRIISNPYHREKLRVLYQQNFAKLKGVTAAMSSEITTVLANGLALGWSPELMAVEINKQIKKIGLARARVIARTEIVRANAEAQLAMFSLLGIDKVRAYVEFVTVGDNKVCVQCSNLEGQVFPVDEAYGIIPVHPNCRCSWVPASVGGSLL